jgi:hypothetical protein
MDGGSTVALTTRRSDDSEISSDAVPAGQATSRGRRWPVREVLIGLAALIVVTGLGYYGYCYWTTRVLPRVH